MLCTDIQVDACIRSLLWIGDSLIAGGDSGTLVVYAPSFRLSTLLHTPLVLAADPGVVLFIDTRWHATRRAALCRPTRAALWGKPPRTRRGT